MPISDSGAARPTVPGGAPLRYLPVPAFNDNYIWLVTDGRDAAVIDPGQAEPVLAALREQGLVLSAILLTHHHADHVGGVAALLDSVAPGAVRVYGPAGETIAHLTDRLHGGDEVVLTAPAARFSVIDVPGHTRGHIAFFQEAVGEAPPRVFCGDTLFATGCGRIFEGTPAQMLHSLSQLAALPAATRVHCAHEYTVSNIRFALACDGGNPDLLAWHDKAQALRARGEPTLPTTIGDEHRVNPFLRATQPAILASLTRHLGRAPADPLEAFTALRAWKDTF